MSSSPARRSTAFVARVLAVVAAISCVSASHAGAQEPRKVTYRVNAGLRTDDMVSVVINCCGDAFEAARAIPHKIGEPCTAAQLPCEIILIQEDGDTYEFKSRFYGTDPNRPETTHQVISNRGRFTSPDPTRRKNELIADLRTLITCHEYLQHGVKMNPDGFPEICKYCGAPPAGEMKVAPPTAQSK